MWQLEVHDSTGTLTLYLKGNPMRGRYLKPGFHFMLEKIKKKFPGMKQEDIEILEQNQWKWVYNLYCLHYSKEEREQHEKELAKDKPLKRKV